jgi:hypothetical protein
MKFCIVLLILSFFSINLLAKDTVTTSIYTKKTEEISEAEFMALALKAPSSLDNISLACLETTDSKNYIGLWHNLTIKAPLKDVANILENFNNYPDFFEGIENSKLIKKIDQFNYLVEFENKSPVFFIPNIQYQMEYKISDLKNGKFFRYHLSSLYPQKNIIFSDGVIYLTEVNGVTKFYELDFFKADWGIAEKLASTKIWPDSIKELVISDFELKIKAENLKITKNEKQNAVKKLLDQLIIEKCVKNKINAADFLH